MFCYPIINIISANITQNVSKGFTGPQHQEIPDRTQSCLGKQGKTL